MCVYAWMYKLDSVAVQGTAAASIDQQTRAVKSLIFGVIYFFFFYQHLPSRRIYHYYYTSGPIMIRE
jgi:TRAP-type C4-dicarboxylate transport system permease small subunit